MNAVSLLWIWICSTPEALDLWHVPRHVRLRESVQLAAQMSKGSAKTGRVNSGDTGLAVPGQD